MDIRLLVERLMHVQSWLGCIVFLDRRSYREVLLMDSRLFNVLAVKLAMTKKLTG
jgi:hypothetical protein